MVKPQNRCAWAQGPEMIKYHDSEWGIPVHSDKKLFEMLTLEGAQAGLSWSTILKRRKTYQKAFDNFDSTMFDVKYVQASNLEAIFEGFVDLTKEDKINFSASFNFAKLTDSSKVLPYTIPIKLNGNYLRNWTENFGTEIGFYYIGERYTGLSNNNKLPGFMNLKIRADYRFTNNFKIYANFENLLNNDIYIWNGYKERSLFLSAGLIWQFN